MMLPINRLAMLEYIVWRRSKLIIIGCMRMTHENRAAAGSQMTRVPLADLLLRPGLWWNQTCHAVVHDELPIMLS